jgi:hypothetical protein
MAYVYAGTVPNWKPRLKRIKYSEKCLAMKVFANVGKIKKPACPAKRNYLSVGTRKLSYAKVEFQDIF